jgi:hypothetical protein
MIMIDNGHNSGNNSSNTGTKVEDGTECHGNSSPESVVRWTGIVGHFRVTCGVDDLLEYWHLLFFITVSVMSMIGDVLELELGMDRATRRTGVYPPPPPTMKLPRRSGVPLIPQQRGMSNVPGSLLLTSPSTRTVITGPPLTKLDVSEGKDSSRSDDSCSTTSVESLSDSWIEGTETSSNPAGVFVYDDVEPSAQDYACDDFISTASSDSPVARQSRMYVAEEASRPRSRSSIKRHEEASRPRSPPLSIPVRTSSNRHEEVSRPRSRSLSPVRATRDRHEEASPSRPRSLSPTTASINSFSSSSLSISDSSQSASPTTSRLEMSVTGLPPPPCSPAENPRMMQFASSKAESMCERPLQSALKTPRMYTLKNKSKSLSFSEPLARDMVTNKIFKGFPSKEEFVEAATKMQSVVRGRQGRIKSRCIEAATKIQSVARGRQGRIKFRYFMLLQQVSGVDVKTEQAIRVIQEELKYKKKDLLDRALARSMRSYGKLEKLAENRAIVLSLRKDNRKRRTQHSLLDRASAEFSREVCELENSIAVKEFYFAKLKKQADRVRQENEILAQVGPQYLEAFVAFEEKVEIYTEKGEVEFKQKVLTKTFLLAAAEMLEGCKDKGLKKMVDDALSQLPDEDE